MSYCDCYYDDGDPPKFVRVTNIKTARKAHKCIECNGPILRGEPYRHVVGCWYANDIETMDTCHLCLELEQWAKISVPCFCNITGELHERVREMVGDVAPHTPGFFFEYGRRMVRIRSRVPLASGE